MLVQGFLNWLSGMVAALLDPIPTLPPEMSSALVGGNEALEQFASTAALLGPIVPYAALQAMAATMVPLVGFWSVILVVRMVAWGLGR